MTDPTRGGLIDVADSLLCVIDTQPGFADKLDRRVAHFTIGRIAWIAALAGALGVRVVVTEEEPEANGSTLPEVVKQLPLDLTRHRKPTFGLADVSEIAAAVTSTGRRTAVLTGMETDVCVSHSALGLLDLGLRVVVVRDAVAAPGDAHLDGLERMRDAGAILIGTKGLFYEWTRTVEGARDAGLRIAAVPLPDGLGL